MRTILLAAAIALPVATSAGIPPMTLPDLTFPSPKPDISTQGCVSDQEASNCNPAE